MLRDHVRKTMADAAFRTWIKCASHASHDRCACDRKHNCGTSCKSREQNKSGAPSRASFGRLTLLLRLGPSCPLSPNMFQTMLEFRAQEERQHSCTGKQIQINSCAAQIGIGSETNSTDKNLGILALLDKFKTCVCVCLC